MKKMMFALLGLALISVGLSACADDDGDGCKYCYTVELDENNNPIESTKGTSIEYCGSDLDAVDGVTDTDPDGNKVKYVCDESMRK